MCENRTHRPKSLDSLWVMKSEVTKAIITTIAGWTRRVGSSMMLKMFNPQPRCPDVNECQIKHACELLDAVAELARNDR
jgi:hypothetical protein